MIPRISILLSLVALFTTCILAQASSLDTQITAAPSRTEAVPSHQTPSPFATSTSLSSPTVSPHIWDGFLSSAEYLLDELDEHFHIDLRKRQGGVAATNAPQATSVPTQMPSVTTYGADRGWTAVVYTQTFAAVPDQWPSPKAGTIGLGTIQGEIGVIKTKSKRMAMPYPTGQMLRIKGREVVIP